MSEIEIKNVSKKYETKDGTVEALKNVSLSIEQGDIYGIIGMSGAGKSTTLKMMEDMGYFCVDNMPIPLMTKLTELLIVPNGEITKIALGLDIRSGQNLRALDQVLDELEKTKIPLEILFLESNDDTLVKRYKETRRNHPLSKGGRIENGIAKERKKIAFLKERADYILDTSRMLTRELRSELNRIFAENKEYKNLYITVLSFGFKYGIPADADLVFDVRFLPNPYYVEGLRQKNGNDKEIQDFVMQYKEAHVFLDKLEDMIKFLIPIYITEGKSQLVIAIGCTGGKHRSVTLANELFKRLEKQKQFGIKIEHRDIEKDTMRH